MENKTELTLSDLRRYIIRYGAKAMDAYESDLFYDCRGVENLEEGETIFWMVSASHTYLYSAREITEHNLNVGMLAGNILNYRIDCVKGRFGDKEYAMTRVGMMEIQMAVNEYQKTMIN